MSNEIVNSACINPTGASASERRLSVVQHASGAAIMALSNASGAVGKAARAKSALMGQSALIQAACKTNYRPVAEYISALTGKPTVISNRASFESLPDQFEAAVLAAKSGKSGGYRTNKDGIQVPNAALSLAMRLKAEMTELVAHVAQYHEEAAAERAKAKDATPAIQ